MKDGHSIMVATGVAVGDTERVPDTLENLIRRCHGRLLTLLFARLRSTEAPPAVPQEAYMRLLRYRGERSGEDLRRTLFSIAGNLLTSHWRRRRAQRTDTPASPDDLDIENGQPSLERQLTGEQQVKRLENVIFSMPEKRRTVLLMSRIEGLRNPEIAERLGISAKTVEKHLAIAIEECRAEVGDDDDDLLAL